jgi:hypothetical protein
MVGFAPAIRASAAGWINLSADKVSLVGTARARVNAATNQTGRPGVSVNASASPSPFAAGPGIFQHGERTRAAEGRGDSLCCRRRTSKFCAKGRSIRIRSVVAPTLRDGRLRSGRHAFGHRDGVRLAPQAGANRRSSPAWVFSAVGSMMPWNAASRCSTGMTFSANRRMFSSARWCGMLPKENSVTR